MEMTPQGYHEHNLDLLTELHPQYSKGDFDFWGRLVK